MEPSKPELARQLAQIPGLRGSCRVTSLRLTCWRMVTPQDTDAHQRDQRAFVNTAEQLLDEHETGYGLTCRSDSTSDERRQRLLTKVRSARGGSPLSIKSAFIGYDNGTTVWEISQDVAESWMALRDRSAKLPRHR